MTITGAAGAARVEDDIGLTGRTPAELTLDAGEGFAMSASCPDEAQVDRFNPRSDDRVLALASAGHMAAFARDVTR